MSGALSVGDRVRHKEPAAAELLGIGTLQSCSATTGISIVRWEHSDMERAVRSRDIELVHILNPHSDLSHLLRHRPTALMRVLADRALDAGRLRAAKALLRPVRLVRLEPIVRHSARCSLFDHAGPARFDIGVRREGRIESTTPINEAVGSAWNDFIRSIQRVSWSQRYIVPAPAPAPAPLLTVDAIFDAMEKYLVRHGEDPAVLFANRHELREAIRHMEGYEWAASFEAGTLFGMRLDLNAPPGVWSVGAES